MPRKVRQVFTNFSAGELNPLLNARTDAKAYFEGARQCKNWYLLDEGGVMRRPATQFTAELPAESRIIPFIFAEDEVAIFALSNNRLDVYNSSGTAISANITSNCNWTTAQLFELSYAQFADTVFICHRNNPIVQIKRTGASAFSVSLYSFETNDDVTVGGVSKTLQPFYKYAASSIIYLSKKKEKDGTEVIGNIIHCKNHKSRLTIENKMVDVRLTYDKGLDRYYGLLELAEKYGVFKKVSTRYEMPDGSKQFGKSILADPTLFFTDDIMKQLDDAAEKEFKYGQSEEIEESEDVGSD